MKKSKFIKKISIIFSLLILSTFSHSVNAEDVQQGLTVKVQIKNHRFIPSQVKAPANTPFALIVENLDPTIEEFESVDLKREKIVGGNKTIYLKFEGLSSGEYEFFGDFNKRTAFGKLIVK